MGFSISLYSVHARKLEDFHDFDAALRLYHEKGIAAVDFLESELVGTTLKDYYGRMTASGMGVTCFVATSDFITAKGAALKENTAKVKGFIDTLSELGVGKIMLAPMVTSADTEEEFYAQREMMVEGYGAMAEYAKGSGVKVTIENQSVAQRADSYIRDCKYIIDAVPELGFVLDTGNFYCVKDDVLEAYEVMKDRIVHCHVKDWEAHDYGRIIRSYLPPLRSSEMGKGVIPLDTLLNRMKADGYDGTLLLEINGRPIFKDLLDQSADYLLSFV